ncbi:hypothetical protein BC829DRAFT_207450 [Chytridium lagenaria]|nr:hypothetical protein BC829DRAFT_207450 [Chytridium lagenaria]
MLRDCFKPFSLCAKTVFLNVIIITTVTAVIQLLFHYIFLWTCLSKETGVPFAEDTRVFGILLAQSCCTVAVLPMANRRPWIAPWLDYILVSILGHLSYMVSWIFVPQWSAVDYILKAFIPLLVVNGTINGPTIHPGKESSIFASLLDYFINSVAYVFVFAGYVCLGSGAFYLSNQLMHKRNALGTSYTLLEEFTTTGLYPFVLGVGFPLCRYGLVLLHKILIVTWKSPPPNNRPQEIAVNASKHVFHISQQALWNALGNVIIFRSQSYSAFCIAVVGSQLANMFERILSCYLLRRKLTRRMTVDPVLVQSGKVLFAKETEDEDEGAAMRAFEPGAFGQTNPISASVMGSQTSRNSRMGSQTSRQSRMGLRQSRIGSQQSRIEAQAFRHSRVADKTKSGQADLFNVRESCEFAPQHEVAVTIAASGELPEYPAERQHGLDEKDNTLQAGVDDFDVFGVEIPFIPLEEKVVYGFHRLGSMIGEWSSIISSCLLVMLLSAFLTFLFGQPTLALSRLSI